MPKIVGVAFNKKGRVYNFDVNNYDLIVGDTVIVENTDGDEVEATVVDKGHFNFKFESDENEFNRLLMVAGVEAPLKKVLGTVERTYFNYKEEEEECE